MAERMAENAHDSWALKKKRELESLGQSSINSHRQNVLRSVAGTDADTQGRYREVFTV